MGKEKSRRPLRRKFTPELKLEVVQLCRNSNTAAAVRKFQVSRRSVKRWCEQQKALCFQVFDRKWRNGRRNTYESNNLVEHNLYKWVDEQLEIYAGTRPTTQDKCIQKTLEKNPESNNITNQHHYNNTRINESFNEDEDLLEFHKNIRLQNSIHDYGLTDIGIICDIKVPYVTCNCNSEVTILLSALADGRKLNPVVIFRGQDLPPSIKIPSDVCILVNENEYPGAADILWWLKHVWKLSKYNNRRLLISSIEHSSVQETLRTLASQYCSSDVINVPNCLRNFEFLSALFSKAFLQCDNYENVLDKVDFTWKRLIDRNIIDGFVDCGIVSCDDVYLRDDETEFLGFGQDDIDSAIKTAERVRNDANDVINNLMQY